MVQLSGLLAGDVKQSRLDSTAATDTLSKNSELAPFRVLQESLTNIVRHSGSKTADISFQSNAETAISMIRGYGRGIPAEKLNSFNETGAGVGVGLGGMKQRIRERGGYFRVRSDGSGRCATAILPFAREEKAGAELTGRCKHVSLNRGDAPRFREFVRARRLAPRHSRATLDRRKG